MDTRAILIERYGPPDVLVEREVPLAEPGPDEVQLEVEAAGVNFADLMMRCGLYSTVPPRPYSPGFEVAGRVRRIGSAVTDVTEGERYVALLRYGGYANEVNVPAGQLLPWPGDFDAASAAALPVVFLTAAVCLFATGHAKAGERVLILGAGGGVGTAAVQLAVQAGLEVYGTAGSPRKREFVVEELGARACYQTDDWEQPLTAAIGARGLDLVLDPVGGPKTSRGLRQLAPLGRLVFYGLSEAAPGNRRNWLRVAWAWLRTPWIHPLSLVEPNRSVHGVHLLHLHEKEGVLRDLFSDLRLRFANGELRPVLDRTFPLTREGAAAAHAYLHARQNLGKVVLTRSV